MSFNPLSSDMYGHYTLSRDGCLAAEYELVLACYDSTKSHPKDERFGLTQQVRRAAVSIPANIAEGQGRWHRREFLHHIAIARGSLQELETLLEIAERLGYIASENLRIARSLADEVSRMLSGLRRALA